MTTNTLSAPGTETVLSPPLEEPMPLSLDQAVVASYSRHLDAEAAIRLLAKDGLRVEKISIIGRNFQTREDVEGFYRPSDAMQEGAQVGAWVGGLFGLLVGMGFFVIPLVGAVFILGPLAGLVAGALSGAGVGALINGLVFLGIPRDKAIKYQERIQAGEFLVVFHGATLAETQRAVSVLAKTSQTTLQTHSIFHGGEV